MPFDLVRPATVEEAVRALAEGPTSRPIAGGTDLLNDLASGRVLVERLVSLARLPWRRIARSDGTLVIGSTLPLRSVERFDGIAGDLPGLSEAVASVGSVPLRHRATLGGNLARAAPTSDLVPILLALGAELEIVGPAGTRRAPLDQVLRASRRLETGRGELVAAVRIPARAPCAYSWQRVRPSNDISQIGVAVARPPGARSWAVAVGGILPRPRRVPRAEALLGAVRPEAETLRRAAEQAAAEVPITADRRASEAYRRRVIEVLVRRTLARAMGPEGVA